LSYFLHGQEKQLKGTLFIVATPIGNSGDITERAKQVLNEAAIVAAEDTRTTQKLFRILGIQNKTVSNHKFNEKHQVDFLISELEKGKNVALVSDAGTPCISDPGGIIVNAAAKRGIRITGICGASAVITALSVCGFEYDSFTFYGFLPRTANDIKNTIQQCITSQNNSKHNKNNIAVFFESPKRIKKTMETFTVLASEAELCLCNDLTKIYERIYRGTPEKILNELNENPSVEKGEYTLVMSFNNENNTNQNGLEADIQISPEALLTDYIIKNGGTLKNAVSGLSEINKNNLTRKQLYSASLNLRRLFTDDEAANPDKQDSSDD